MIETINQLCLGSISPARAYNVAYWVNGRLQVERKLRPEDYASARSLEKRENQERKTDLETKFGPKITETILDPRKRTILLNALESLRWYATPFGLEMQRRWRQERLDKQSSDALLATLP